MLDKLSALYRIELDEEGLMIEGFADGLKSYTSNQIGRAFRHIVEHDKWFPTIAYTREVLEHLFPGDEYKALPAPPQTVEDVAAGFIATGFIGTIKSLQKPIDYESEYNKYRKANWTEALKRAAKEMADASQTRQSG